MLCDPSQYNEAIPFNLPQLFCSDEANKGKNRFCFVLTLRCVLFCHSLVQYYYLSGFDSGTINLLNCWSRPNKRINLDLYGRDLTHKYNAPGLFTCIFSTEVVTLDSDQNSKIIPRTFRQHVNFSPARWGTTNLQAMFHYYMYHKNAYELST